MKRVYYACPNRNYSVKMYEAPASWLRFPNACRLVTTAAVRESRYPDLDRLFSALMRVVKRQMTFNEASASHHVSLNVIKKVFYSGIFSKMSQVMMRLMDEKKKDLELLGSEMDESAFQFDIVTEEDLITTTNEQGEQFAIVDPALGQSGSEQKPAIPSPSKEVKTEEVAPGPSNAVISPPAEKRRKTEERDYRARGLDVTPQQLVKPKEEELDLFPNVLNSNPDQFIKEEELDEFYPNQLETSYDGLNSDERPQMLEVPDDSAYESSGLDYKESAFKFEEDDQYSPDKVIKPEPADDPVLSQHNDSSLLRCSMDDFGFGCSKTGQEDEEEEQELIDPDERDYPEIAEAITMALNSSKVVGKRRSVMREALKDSLLRDVSVSDIAKVYEFVDQSAISNLINKTRLFLKGICRRSGKSLPAIVATSSAYTKVFNPGEPLDPNDTKRIEKIRDVLASLVKRCMYPRIGKEQLKQALYAVCSGELTLNGASNKYNLPSSTIHPYLNKARIRLGSILPPQANAPNLWSSQMKKYKPSQVAPATSATGKLSYTMEELDKTVAELVMSSHYDNVGKQSILDGVLAVITEGISVPDATKKTGIPPSTIQTYVARAREALGIPSKTDTVEFVPRRKEAPTVALMSKQDIAPRKDVERYTHKMLKVMADETRRRHVFRAVVAAVMGEMTIREASIKEDLAASSVHPYVTKVRHILGQRCPPAKLISNAKTPAIAKRGARADDEEQITIPENEAVSIDGIIVPKSIRLLSRLITIGRVDYSEAAPFLGTREELKEKLTLILQAFNFRGHIGNLAKGIMHVYVDDNTISEACQKFKLSQTTLSSYARAIKIFIDFAKSPCSSEYRNAEAEKQRLQHSENSPDPVNDPLPRPPLPTSDHDIKQEDDCDDFVKEELEEEEELEPIESLTPEFLTIEEQLEDDRWEGEDLDCVTRKMQTLYQCRGWKYDSNGDNNAHLLPTLLLPQVSENMKMERLKTVIQYVVNDRHAGKRERLYIRPLLIHHMCNGFSLDHLLALYGDRVPLSEQQLNAYCSIIADIYKKTGNIMLELLANLTKCFRIIDVKDEEGREQLENLNSEMRKRFPFLAEPRWVPTTTEKLSEIELARRKMGTDVYMYFALLAMAQLRKLGFRLNRIFINELVRMTVFNINGTICHREYATLWASKYIKCVIEKNRASI